MIVTIPDIAGSVLLESPDVSEVKIELSPVSQVRPGRLKKIGALLQHRRALIILNIP